MDALYCSSLVLLATKRKWEAIGMILLVFKRDLVLGRRLDHALAAVTFGGKTSERLGALVLLYISLYVLHHAR